MDGFLVNVMPYVVLITFCALITYKSNKKLASLLLGVMFLFSAIRYDVGWDYSEYYSHIDSYDIERAVLRFELIPKWMAYISNGLGMPTLFFVFHAFFTLFFLYLFLKKKSKNVTLSLFIYLTIPLFFLDSLSIVRFHLAMSAFLLSTCYYDEKKYVLFALFLSIAIASHTSAYICLIYPLLKRFPLNRTCMILSLAISFVFSKSLWMILQYVTFIPGLQIYIQRAGEISGFSLLPLLLLFFGIINLLYYKKLVQMDSNMRYYISYYNIGCCFMYILSFEVTLASRISRFFLLYLLLIFPYYVSLFKYRKLQKQLYILFLIFIFLFNLYWSSRAYYLGLVSKDQFLPYKTVFSRE